MPLPSGKPDPTCYQGVLYGTVMTPMAS